MKKLCFTLLIFGFIFFIVKTIAYANEQFEDFIIDSKKIELPLLQKVFPEVEFLVETSKITMPPSKRIMGKLNDKTYLMPWEFNILFKEVEKNSKASVEERIESFILLTYWLRDNNLKIISNKPISKKVGSYTLNREVKVMVNEKEFEILILFKDNQIIRADIFIEREKRSLITPTLLGMKAVNISIDGVTGVAYPPGTHYYIPVSNNGTTTNNTIIFIVTGLQPNQQNVHLQIKPIYGYSGVFFLDHLLVVDGSGYSSYTWTPPNNNNTGICEVQVDTSGTIIPFNNIWVIPEHIITGTFNSGYNYTVYFTNQFFTFHPSGINHAQTFAYSGETAITESWDEQVINWSLAQGLTNNQPEDDDDNYQLCVNDHDSNHQYHGTYTNHAFGGSNRKIGIRYDSYMTQPLYSSELMRVKVAMSHEFYHGIQYGHNSWNSGDWLTEGEARALPSIQYPSEEYLETIQHFYPVDSNNYLIYYLNTSLLSVSYRYCLYWRFLYEHYRTGTTAQKLEIFRESCQYCDSETIQAIESGMNTALGSTGGIYSTMDASIETFAKNAYLNDPSYNLWNPCPSDDFYTSPPITNDSDGDGITNTFDGTLIEEPNNIPSSFGIDYMVFDFEQGVSDVILHFDGDPDDDNEMADFYVNVLIFNGTNYSENIITLDNGEGYLEFEVDNQQNPIDKALALIARLDADENTGLDSDYIITLAPTERIDVALVIDRSGSMGGNKITQAKNAASQFVQLLNIGDEVAVCSYSSSASTNFAITEITSQQTIEDAVIAISGISAGGMTSIGAGMLEGQGQLYNCAIPNYNQGMLLLSDGWENTSPMVADILPTIPEETDIYTIGFGDGCDEALMRNIAAVTGGFYKKADDDGSNIGLICNLILNAIFGQQMIATFSGSIAGGGREVIEHNIVLDSLCSQVTFNLMWEHNDSDLDLVLIDPNNTEIDSAYAASDTTIYFYSYETQEFYRIDEPDYGDWTLKIIGVTVPYGTENYDATVAGFSGIEMQVAFDQDSYVTGQPIVITAELTVEGNPIIGVTVTTEVENPNYIIDSLTLYDDGNHEDGVADDGIYGNSYNNANQGGSYTFTIFASGTAPVGGDFTRIASRSTFVSGPTVYQTTIDAGYNMVAVPGIPTPSDPVSIFGDDIIPFYTNTNNSNIWWWSEINSSYWVPDEIINGYGYWLKAWEDNTTIDAQVSPVTMPVAIPLTNSAAYYIMQHGWHMLGNPFNYQIDYGDNNFNISAEVSPWCYIYENGHYNLYLFDNTKSINPWQAFWVHTNANNEEVEMFLSIKEEGLQSYIVSTINKDNKSREITNWEIQLLVSLSDMEDVSNYAGINENASDGWDVMDVPEIGSPNPDYVSLYFPHNDWGQYSADYTRNVRSPALSDNEWYFIVYSTESGEAQLTWNIPVEVPEDYQLEITDLENGNTMNIKEASEYIFNINANNEYEFVFTVVTYGIGPEPDIPTIFGLSTNYPNPFSHSTIIKYQLPQRADVAISIYNIKGQKIRTLISKEKEAGYHNTCWDGKDDNGVKVSNGIYFYRFETDKFKETKKMLFII